MRGRTRCYYGGANGNWIRLGWAYNETPSEPDWEPELDDQFPEIVLRGAARLHPKLKIYYGRLPARRIHYGGWYSMTKENWPLVGPMKTDGMFVVGAMSGFGTMLSCAAGELCASWVSGSQLPHYARSFSMKRYGDKAFMSELLQMQRGIL